MLQNDKEISFNAKDRDLKFDYCKELKSMRNFSKTSDLSDSDITENQAQKDVQIIQKCPQ